MNKRTHEKLAQEIQSCTRCPLAATRTNAVPGEGPVPSRILLIGEAPGRNEDRQGRPFVGRAGTILDGGLASAGIGRKEVYITNIVKCRPPNNRDPTREEMDACRPYLERQMELLSPGIIVPLGRFAMHTILNAHGITPGTIGSVHGKVFYGEAEGRRTTIVPVYHPAAAIYDRGKMDDLVEDFRTVRAVLDGKIGQ